MILLNQVKTIYNMLFLIIKKKCSQNAFWHSGCLNKFIWPTESL